MSLFFEPAHDDDPPAPPRRRGHWVRRVLAVAAVVALTVAAAGTLYVHSVSRTFSANVHRESLLPPRTAGSGSGVDRGGEPSTPAASSSAAGQGNAVNYVLMGSDSRDASNAGAGRSDSLMLLHLDADRQHAYLISFPRDMYVPVPGHGDNKINAAFAYGGPPLAVATVENLLGLRVDHAVVIDFQGFVGLTNQLGGVTVRNEHASSSHAYHFPAGDITIMGEQALAFVRERHDLPNGDLDRAARQRLVVKAIIEKGLSPETLTNPGRFSDFVSGAAQHLTVDDRLSDAEVRRTALSLRLGPGDITLLQAPVRGFGTVNGQSIDVVDQAGLAELATALQNDTMPTYLANHPAR